MATFRRARTVIPHSVLLEWVALDGGIRQWLFTADHIVSRNTKFDFVNNINSFRGIPQGRKVDVALTTFSLSTSEYDHVKDLQFTNLLTLTFLDPVDINNLSGFSFRAGLSSIKVSELNPLTLRDFSLKVFIQDSIPMSN